MSSPITTETLHTICSYWAKIIKAEEENGVHIWAPCESARYRFMQFIKDSTLQDELFGTIKPILLLVDGYEQKDIQYEDLKNQISESLGQAISSEFDLNEWLSQHKDQPLVLFLIGFDTALSNNNTIALQRMATLPNRYLHQNLKVILFTSSNILESVSYNVLLRSSNILQNITYQPIFEAKDIIQFSHYFSDQWGIKIPETMNRFFVEDIGGHFLLVKEAIRLLRDNLKISREEILQSPSMVRRGMAIFERLSEKDKKTVQSILLGNKSVSVSEYLSKTHLIYSGTVGLPYWNHIKNAITTSVFDSASVSTSHSIEFYLTSTELDVFELLIDAKKIIAREQIAEQIWHQGWEDKYSDWAIDQLMHRIREKLKLTSSPYSIQTKKGQGFFITGKD